MVVSGFALRPKVDFSIADANENDLVYKLFQNPSENGTILRFEYLSEDDFDPCIPTVVFLHGWSTNGTPSWYDALKNEYFKLGPHNILYVNWSKAGNKTLEVSCANTKPLGRYVAEFLLAAEIPLDKIHIVGHSLGGHLAGFIGKCIFSLTGKKIARITGLDPAGPKFNNPEMSLDDRLCQTDAEFVDVIHTDINYAGFTLPIGHIDFYPNGGTHQPGCPSRIEDGCSNHERAIHYFIESLGTKIEAQQGYFIEKRSLVVVVEEGEDQLFGYHVNCKARGVYYLETRGSKPFLSCL